MEQNYLLIKKTEWDDKLIKKIDDFIMSNFTNGEFINTVNYLSYHKNRFVEDSVVIINKCSNDVCCLMMGNSNGDEFVSHSGTTFSGFIYDYRTSFNKLSYMFSMIMDYYESKYKKIVIKQSPSFFSKKPINIIDYLLLQRGYTFTFSDLTCVMNIGEIVDDDSLFMKYDSKRRNEIRKSIKSNSLKFVLDDEISENIWQQMNENLQNRYSSKTTHTFDEITDLKKRFPNKIMPYSVYTNEGDYASFGLIYKFKNVFHTQYLDMNYKYANIYPNLFLIHNVILIAKKEGYSLFSFGGCTKSDHELNVGLYEYKTAYGSGDLLLPKYEKII